MQHVALFAPPHGLLKSATLADRSRALMAASRCKAAPLLSNDSVYRTVNGPRRRVYFAPLPLACNRMRRDKSFVMPV